MQVRKKQGNKLVFYTKIFYPYADTSSLLYLYLAYVRPHLVYTVSVYDPNQQALISSLERVQKSALKVSTKNWSFGYESLLQLHNLPTLASTDTA